MPSTPSEALLDVNVIIAAIFEDHPHYDRARRFVERLNKFYTSPTTQGGFLRFATRPWKSELGMVQNPRLTVAEAHAKLLEIVGTHGHVFLPDDASFTELGLKSLQGHRQWTDAYLLCLARKHGTKMASLDERMANLEDPNDSVLCIVD